MSAEDTISARVNADKAADIITSAKARPSPQAGQRAYSLLHLDRELTAEENVEHSAIMCMPTTFYVA